MHLQVVKKISQWGTSYWTIEGQGNRWPIGRRFRTKWKAELALQVYKEGGVYKKYIMELQKIKKLRKEKRKKSEIELKKTLKKAEKKFFSSYKDPIGYCDLKGIPVNLKLFEYKGCWTCHHFKWSNEVITVCEAAKELNVSESTVRRWIKKGIIGAIKIRVIRLIYGVPKVIYIIDKKSIKKLKKTFKTL